MAVAYAFAFLFVLAFSQGSPVQQGHGEAFIEDMRASSPRIVAGWPAEPGQIPHQVSVRMVSPVGSVFSCGGSIIHEQWVLTAAHCVANRLTFVMRFGFNNLTRPTHLLESTRKYIHPRYIEIIAGVQTDDIALIGLDRAIPFGDYVQPIRLQNSQQRNINYQGVVLTVSGNGRNDDLWNGGYSPEVLQWVHLRGITNEECRAWYGGSTTIQEQTICAEYYNNTAQSSCQGDSGGPLTKVDDDGRLTQVGLVSFGHISGCNSPFPSAYVRPGHYHDWFLEVTGINFDWSHDEEAQAAPQPIVLKPLSL